MKPRPEDACYWPFEELESEADTALQEHKLLNILVTESLCSWNMATGRYGRCNSHTFTPKSSAVDTLAICVGLFGRHFIRDTALMA